jgi:hypothetical protein
MRDGPAAAAGNPFNRVVNWVPTWEWGGANAPNASPRSLKKYAKHHFLFRSINCFGDFRT